MKYLRSFTHAGNSESLFNPLAPGKWYSFDLKCMIFKYITEIVKKKPKKTQNITEIVILSISCETASRWMWKIHLMIK